MSAIAVSPARKVFLEERRREIFQTYRRRAAKLAKFFVIPGAEANDVEQESLILLWDYAEYLARKEEPIESMRPLVTTFIKGRLGEVCRRRGRRLKDLPLLQSERVFLNQDAEEIAILEVIADQSGLGRDPLSILIDREFLSELLDGFRSLSVNQRDALRRTLGGEFPTDHHERRVQKENAVCARSRLRKHLGLSTLSQSGRARRRQRVAELSMRGHTGYEIARILRTAPATIYNDLGLMAAPEVQA